MEGILTLILLLSGITVCIVCSVMSLGEITDPKEYYETKTYKKTFDNCMISYDKTLEITDTEAEVLDKLKKENKDLYNKILKEYKIDRFEIIYTDFEYSLNKVFLKLKKEKKK